MSVIILIAVGAKILIIDHNDSFTYNLVGLFETCAGENPIDGQVASVEVWTVQDLESMDLSALWQFDALVLSPGPGLPKDYPLVLKLLKLCLEGPRKMPVLGICLGLQAIVTYFGGVLYNLPRIQHGRQVKMDITQTGTVPCTVSPLFTGLSMPIMVGLYHSWGMDSNLPVRELEILATAEISEKGKAGFSKPVVMAVGHKYLPVYGLQFHPESYMTPEGGQIIRNWLSLLDLEKKASG